MVVSSPEDAFNLAADFASSRIRHALIRHDNYIERPRPSGYRGLHLVYSFNSDRPTPWQGLKTEIQFRSRLQHQWATAVETVGTFLGEDLKSSEGDPTWLRFFALMSTVIAERENAPAAPNTPADYRELVSEIKVCDERLGILEQLEAFRILTRQVQNLDRSNLWIVLELEPKARKITAAFFGAKNWEAANSRYLEREVETRGIPQVEIVLVSANSLSALRRAYPNFFLDLSAFRRVVRETVERP